MVDGKQRGLIEEMKIEAHDYTDTHTYTQPHHKHIHIHIQIPYHTTP